MAWPWSRKTDATEPPGPPPSAGDVALEVLAHTLRTLGRTAFDVGEQSAVRTQKLFDAWAEHIAVLAPHPERPDDEAARKARDWGGLRRFVAEHRKREQAWVGRSVEGLREAVWLFVKGLDEVLAADASTDDEIAAELDRLRDVLAKGDPEELAFEVARATREIARIQEERRKGRRSSSEELVKRVRAFAGELQEARREGTLDPLTELYNQKAFDEHLRRAASLGAMGGQPATLLVCAVDTWKETVEAHGGAVGDAVLQDVAEALGRSFIGRGDFLARLGGETFAVVLSDTRLQEARPAIARLVATVRGVRAKEAPVTLSIGVAAMGRESFERWYMRADRAMRTAVEEGGDRVVEARDAGPPVLTLVT